MREQTEEVDDVVKTLETSTPATGLSAHVASTHSAFTAPGATVQGTGLPFAGAVANANAAMSGVVAGAPAGAAARTTAQVALAGARVIDLPGSPPRGAPV